ncbi:hypothetical protein B0H10DRAFT_1920769, partial [Mycena sp. CBHHK59/15]
MVSTRTIYDMPIRGTKSAPSTFEGDYDEVEHFITHYEKLLIQNNVLTAADQCESLLEYCSRSVEDFIRATPAFQDRNWSKLKSTILKYYDAELIRSGRRPEDVLNLILKTRQRPLKSLTQWKRYYRKYLGIAGRLFTKGKISEMQYNGYFWSGLPQGLQMILENKLSNKYPAHDLTDPFSVEQVSEIAEAYFQRDKFSQMLLGTGPIQDTESTDDDSNSGGSEDDDSSEEEARRKRRKKMRVKKNKRRTRHKDVTGGRLLGKLRESDPKVTEVEGMIKQLNSMSIEDPTYPSTYFKVMAMDATGIAKQCVRPPSMPRSNPPPRAPPYRSPYTGAPGSGFPQSQQPNYQQAPPQNFSTHSPAPPANPGCYGCNEQGHRIGNCTKLQDLISKGLIQQDSTTRRYVLKDGSPIIRWRGETLAGAAERLATQQTGAQPMRSHFVTLGGQIHPESNDDEYTVYSVPAPGSDSDDLAPLAKIMPVTRSERKLQDARQGGTKISPSTRSKMKEQTPHRDNQEMPSPDELVPIQRPIEVRKPRKVQWDDNKIDEKSKESNKQRTRNETLHPDKPSIDDSMVTLPPVNESSKPKGNTRQSELSAQVEKGAVVNKVLDTLITLPLRELLANSRELSNGVQDLLKMRNPAKVTAYALRRDDPMIAATFVARNRGFLIEMLLECGGKTITAIIDTGSQLNIVREDIAHSIIRKPIDLSHHITVNDANGGEGVLKGLVSGVLFACGGVTTSANLYVGKNSPFDLLLGRPWQRGNMVSIDERENGTYLLFKDPLSMDGRYELLVSDERLSHRQES